MGAGWNDGGGDFGRIRSVGCGIVEDDDALLRLTHPTSDVLGFMGLWVEPLGNILIDLL